MLPGFRFLFAAIVLSTSILVFGLGAAALLRAAHEEVASNPSWHAAPETIFAQQSEATRPVLAILHVEPPPTEQKAAADNASTTAAGQATTVAAPPEQAAVTAAPPEQAAVAAAPPEQTAVAGTPPEQATVAAAPPEPEKTAAFKQEELPSAETAKPEMPASESSAQNSTQNEVAPGQADVPASSNAPAPPDEPKMAATEQTSSPASEAAPPATEAPAAAPAQASAPPTAKADVAWTNIATLRDPSVPIEAQPPAKAADAKPLGSVIRKRVRARRAANRRKVAARARAVALQAPWQPGNPFAQPTIQAPTPARKP